MKTALESLEKATQEKRRPTLKQLGNQAALTLGGSVGIARRNLANEKARRFVGERRGGKSFGFDV